MATTKTKASPKTRKKVDFDSLAQTHGALEPLPQRSVTDMLGYGSVYTTESLDDYLKHIDALSDADLQDHAVKVGVTPPRERTRLRDRLERQFATAISRKTFPSQPVVMSEEAIARQQRLMRGGW